MKNLLIALLILPLISGCFLYDCGYTRNDDTAIYKTDASNKMPISYSLRFDTCFPANDFPGTPTVKSIRTKIDEALKETGLFSEVSNGDKDEKGYHIEFRYNDSGCYLQYEVTRALVSTITLYMIPVPANYSADLSAVLYLEGKPIWSVAHTEKCRYIVCWYALPAGLFLNFWSVWRFIEYNLVRSTVNDLTREHISRYLDSTTVDLTNPEDVGAAYTQPRQGQSDK